MPLEDFYSKSFDKWYVMSLKMVLNHTANGEMSGWVSANRASANVLLTFCLRTANNHNALFLAVSTAIC